MMREIELEHRCTVYLMMSPGSTRLGPELRCVLTAVSREPGTNLAPCEESQACSWPRGWSVDMVSTVFGLCYALEARLSKAWMVGEKHQLP